MKIAKSQKILAGLVFLIMLALLVAGIMGLMARHQDSTFATLDEMRSYSVMATAHQPLVDQYGKEANAFAALGYDAYMVAVDAIKRADSADPVAIRDALAKTSGFIGATGTITLDENGDAVKLAVVNTIENGAFKFLVKVDP